MGVDISGKNPIIRSPKPAYPDWNTATQKEKDTYFEVSDKWMEENPGEYFRSNWWGWRPIVMLVEAACDKFNLDFDLIHWGSNDGAGLDNQEDCDKLASALELMLVFDENLEDDIDTLYLNLGSWVSSDGKFLGEKINKQLNEQYPIGEVMYSSVVMDDGTIAQPSHSAPVRHVKKFISFLKECGGFHIW